MFRFPSLILIISEIILKAAVVRGRKRLFIKSILHRTWLHLAFPHCGFKCLEIYQWSSGVGIGRKNLFTCSLHTSHLCVIHSKTIRQSQLPRSYFKGSHTSSGTDNRSRKLKVQRIKFSLSVENLNTIIKPTKYHLLFIITMCHLPAFWSRHPPAPLQYATLKGKNFPQNTNSLIKSICVPIGTIQNDSPENENSIYFKNTGLEENGTLPRIEPKRKTAIFFPFFSIPCLESCYLGRL